MGHKLYNVNRLYYEGMDAGRNYFTSTFQHFIPILLPILRYNRFVFKDMKL